MPRHLIGAHMPARGGIANSIRDGHAIGCTAVQVFTSSPRSWSGPDPTAEKIADFKSAQTETGITSVVSHDSYLTNMADADDERARRSIDGLIGEMRRCSLYGIPNAVSHIGAAMGQEREVALARAAQGILTVLAEAPSDVTLLMETTAGQGSSLNSTFEELARLLELTKAPARLAVCLDTCHVFAAGWDIRTPDELDRMWREFDRLIGLDRLRAIHCNDSKKPLASHVDRHDHLGEGEIGKRPFEALVRDDRFFDVPIVVETPAENGGHAKNVGKLWEWSESS